MTSLTKPMLSPGRTEKFPPPLMMKFLRTNMGSRSRGRSRSSQIFVRKNQYPPPIETTQGPPPLNSPAWASSEPAAPPPPPVKNLQKNTPVPGSETHYFAPKKFTPDRFDPIGANTSGLSHLGCRKSKTRDDSAKIEPTMENKNRARDSEDEAEAEVREESREAFASTLPPKNAFLLNRCRSSPYRSSSLASRFWGSPLEKSEAEDDNGEIPTSESEPSCKKSALESKLDREIERKLGFSEKSKVQ